MPVPPVNLRPLALRPLSFFAAAVLTLAGVAACDSEDPMAQPGVIELSDAFKADFELVDQNGEPASDERFEGKPMFIYYGFASCPDVCPAALSRMSATLDALGERASEVQPVFITVDPERDTPDVLKAHLAFDERITGLTGEPAQAEAARKAMKVYAAKKPLENSALDYTMDHQSLFYIVDAEGTPVLALEDTMAPADIAAVLKLWI